MKNEALAAFSIIVITAVFVIAVLSFLPLESLPKRAILDADEIPGDWKLSGSSGGSRMFYSGPTPDAWDSSKVSLNLIQYDNATAAHQKFVDDESYLSYFISQRPELGDECFLASSTGLREIYCRVGDILIYSQITFIPEHYLTDGWIFDLIQLQIDKIQSNR